MSFFRALIIALAITVHFSAAQAEEVRIKPNGLTLNAQLDMATDSLKDGTVLIVHGTLAHNAMDMLTNLRQVLNDRGLNTLAINLSLGLDDRHGMYRCEDPHYHQHLDALDEIASWMDWLKTKGSGPVVLLGHSRGGNQSARFAAERGHELLSKVVLLAPATWDADKTAAAFEKRNGRPLAADYKQAKAMVDAGKGKEMMAKPGLLYCPEAKVSALSFESYYRNDPRFDTPSVLGEIKTPVLVIAGSNDTVVKDLPAKMEGKADGARIKFEVIDGADHFFLDLFAEDVADHMEEFLGSGS